MKLHSRVSLFRCIESVRSAPPFAWGVILVFSWVSITASSIALCGAGFLHPESYSFLPHHLSGRPLLSLIYDNRVTDWNHYQARELASVLDWIDCQFIAFCVRLGYPHFFSASHYVLLFIAGILVWHLVTRSFQLSAIVAFGLALIVWTTPTAILYSSYYRSAKVFLFCATLLAFSQWMAASRSGAGRRGALLFGLSMACLPMCDKQGYLFVMGSLPFLGYRAWVERKPENRRLWVAGVYAAVFAWSYQRVIGPAATQQLLGYAVDRSYVSIPFHFLVSDPGFLGRVLAGSLVFTLDSLRVPMGNLPVGIALVGIVWLWKQFPRRAPEPSATAVAPRGMFCLLMVLIFGVFVAMLMLFPLMFSNEHRRFFYPLPVFALWIAAIAAAMREWVRRHPQRVLWLEIAMGVLVLGNLAALQDHRFVFRHGKYRPYVENAARVCEALRPENLQRVDPAAARTLFARAGYYRDAVPPSLDQDRIYLLFASRRTGQP